MLPRGEGGKGRVSSLGHVFTEDPKCRLLASREEGAFSHGAPRSSEQQFQLKSFVLEWVKWLLSPSLVA